jgi:hypothetical protein
VHPVSSGDRPLSFDGGHRGATTTRAGRCTEIVTAGAGNGLRSVRAVPAAGCGQTRLLASASDLGCTR